MMIRVTGRSPTSGTSWLSRVLEYPDRYRGLSGDALTDVLTRWGPALAVTLAVLGLAGYGAARQWRRVRLAEVWRGARVISVVPPPQVEPAGAAAFWGNLTGLLRPPWRRALAGQPHVAFEYLWDARGARLQVWVPGVIPPGLIERALEAAWPGTHTLTRAAVDPQTSAPIPAAVVSTGGTLRLARSEFLPLAVEHDVDPLRALFSAASGLHPGQRAAVQVLARPVSGARLRRARNSIRQLRSGTSPTLASRLLDAVTPGSAGGRRSLRTPTDPERSAQLRAAAGKASTPSWEVLIRYALSDTSQRPAAGRDRAWRRQVLRVLRGRAHALASAFALYSGANFLTRRRLRHPARALAWRELRRGDLYGVPELAAVAHLPLDASTPGLARAGARAVAPPPEVSTSLAPTPRPATALPDSPGQPAVAAHPNAARTIRQDQPRDDDADSTDEAGAAIKILGDTDTGTPRQAGVRVADARHHLHLIGATGSGKSTLMLHTILDDVRHGRGVVVIDPKGDLVLDLLNRLPISAGRPLALIDPDQPQAPPCLNPLDLAPGEDIDTAVDNLVGIFRRIYSGFWGPRTDDVLRAASLTLLRAPRPTLAAAAGAHVDGDIDPARATIPTLTDIPRLLDDDTYRRVLTAGITDDVLAGFWDWYNHLGAGARANAVGPVLNKLRAFLLRPFVREAIAAGAATLDMSHALDGGIALVRLPKGVLGEETSRLLGSFVVARTWQAASARAAAGRPRIDATLYIDEAHNFLNLPYPIEDMLAEARGYRLTMTIAHQNLAQMPREMRESISANARNKVFFNASPEDARDLERHTQPTLTAHDLSHLGAFQAAVRLVVRSADTAAFTLRTRAMPPAVAGRVDHLRRLANAPTTRAAAPHAGVASHRPARPGRPGHDRPDVRLQFTEPEGGDPPLAAVPSSPAADECAWPDTLKELIDEP